ncbi:MAG: phospholipase A2 [Actinomycetota bacterium]
MGKLVAWTLTVALVAGLLLFGTAAGAEAQTQVDGCTAVPDSGPNFDFTSACNTHDRCYLERPNGDDRAARRQCDVDFFYDMVDLCRADYPGRWFARQGCYSVAGLYYVGVRAFGGFGWLERNTASVTDPAAASAA